MDDEYTGVHGFSGVVIEGTLHLAYIATDEVRLTQYSPSTGWSDAVPMGKATTHSISISNVSGAPTVFSYHQDSGLWYRTPAMDEHITLARLQHDNIHYAWTSTPDTASEIIAVWVEGKESPYKVYAKRLESGWD